MRVFLVIVWVCCFTCAGCTAIPTDMAPKFRWYWSKEAKQYRQDKANNNPEKHQ